jgi:hypothetical protein
MKHNKKARVIAFYLPQYHPIPENDEWWGKGFTEWTNVGKAKPIFKGHYQPKVPADLGYYDLRMPEIREAQADLARQAGIEGFCYWHYWFGSGKQLLEKPFDDVLESGKPDFPFCLGWANHSWTNKDWHIGKKFTKEVNLMTQSYPGNEDHELHFYHILKALKDKRYICVDGMPLFLIYSPTSIPNITSFINLWRKLAIKNGLKGIHFVGITHNLSNLNGNKNVIKGLLSKINFNKSADYYNRILNLGFDAVNSRGQNRAEIIVRGRFKKLFLNLINKEFDGIIADKYNYKKIIKHLFVDEDSWNNVYPTIIPNWDRSPRSGKKALIWYNTTPELFRESVKSAIEIIKDKPSEHKILFLQSWNEWGEGNYVEPDIMYGKGYLNVLRDLIK